MAKCTFCGHSIEQGTGKMFVLNTGETRFYCSNKCEKNHNKLGRLPRNIKWTQEARNRRKK